MSVREAAVDLLGKHISSRQDLALSYFDVLATAVRDPGTSVRKRAVNIMWETFVKQPGFPQATQACVHILTRATDPEDSIQKLVCKVFHNLWFSPPTLTGKLFYLQALPAVCACLCQSLCGVLRAAVSGVMYECACIWMPECFVTKTAKSLHSVEHREVVVCEMVPLGHV